LNLLTSPKGSDLLVSMERCALSIRRVESSVFSVELSKRGNVAGVEKSFENTIGLIDNGFEVGHSVVLWLIGSSLKFNRVECRKQNL
jgi:hypothetical protein